MKELKRKLLFVLGSDVDVGETIEAFGYWSYPQLYWRLGSFRPVSVRGAINGLIKSGEVARIVRDGSPRFRLTAMGRDRLMGGVPFSANKGRWDRAWRVVILDRGVLDKSHLRQLKLALAEFGFVRLEAGVFVSPTAAVGEVKKRLMELNLVRAVTMMETRRFVIGDDRAFATAVWGLDKLVEGYKNLISQSLVLLKEVRRAKRLMDQQKLAYNKINFDWLELLLGVPKLPYKLLPSDWPHLETVELMVKLARAVRELEEEAI